MPRTSRRTFYQWHPAVHTEWAREQLYFWRLAFSPTYDRERIVAGIREALELQGATAFTVYELLAGGYDVFLRAWLPTSQGAFESSLFQALGQHTIVAQAFWANRVLVHWPWETAPGALDVRPVSADALRHKLPDGEIARINNREITPARRAEYEEQNLIAPVKRRPGIKFFTAITTNNAPLTTYATQQLEKKIKAVLGAAQRIEEKSLYAGIGFGEYLLMGRTTDFFAIDEEITSPLNDAVEPSVYGAKTVTFPVGRRSFLDFCYDLRTDDKSVTTHNAAEALEDEESQTVEVKASVFVGVDRWISGGPLERNERVVDDGFLKAVTGLLNADGGTVVVGALERRRFDQHSKLAEYPRRSSYIVLGIDDDLDGDVWDKYERRLRVLLEGRIQPDPNAWISIAHEVLDGRSMCVVTVGRSGRWFYHYPSGEKRPRFWVRQGARTVELIGPESDVYRVEKARQG